MTSRSMNPLTKQAATKSVIPLATFVRLDIQGDPLIAWNGIGPMTFAAGATGDSAMDGLTFDGTGSILEIGTVNDSLGGSDALDLSLPGVNITDPALRQLIYNRSRYQFRRAWVWMAVCDPNTFDIIGLPFRVKTGRMDNMRYTEDKDGGRVTCTIEGQQAYGDEPLGTRYSEQTLLDNTDTSQTYVISLSNMDASIGTDSKPAGSLSSNKTTIPTSVIQASLQAQQR